jgi:cysteine desulfurase
VKDMTKRVYLDHSATTQVDRQVLEQMLPFFGELYGNPNSVHAFGREVRGAVTEARERVASLVGASPKEIFFTGGGSEADNLALKGAAWALKEKGKTHLVTSAIEHHAILHVAEWLSKNGFSSTVLPVDREGFVSPEALKAAIRPETGLVSIMYGNNEVGTVQDIPALGAVCRERGILFHTDAVQAAGHLPIDLKSLPVDLMTMAAHKMYGPKGVGALYVRRGVKLVPLIHGGGQESGLRSGTENTPGIVGFGAAAALAAERLVNGEIEKERALRDRLIDGILSRVDEVILTGSRTARLPFHASVCIRYIEGESMLLHLDMAGIAASSGSACTSGSLDPSHVLLAMGLSHETAHGSLRLTLGKDTTTEDIDYVVETLPGIVETLRRMSPFKRRK